MLPPGFRGRTRSFVSLADVAAAPPSADPQWERVQTLLRKRRRARVEEEVLRRVLGSEGERTVDRLVRRGLLVRSWAWRAPKDEPEGNGVPPSHPGEAPLPPTSPQASALQEIYAALANQEPTAFLLRGLTGSGKTAVPGTGSAGDRPGPRNFPHPPDDSAVPGTVPRPCGGAP